MKKNTVTFLKIAFILFTTYVVTATSYKRDTALGVLKTWGAASNCANAITNNEVLISDNNGFITDPVNRTFLDYGLPISAVRIGVDLTVAATANGITRQCTYSSQVDGGSGKTLSIYSCADNGVGSCVVTFTPM